MQLNKFKKLVIVIAVLIAGILLFGLWKFVIRFLPGMPHEPATITLPFAEKDDDLFGMNPMGETINHPDAPHGHPGIDFIWARPISIIASATGRVSRIGRHSGGPHTHPTWDVVVVSGDFATRYTELDSYAVTEGERLNQGDLIGQAGSYTAARGTHYSIHWEFDYDTFWYDRLCPMTYFEPTAKKRVELIWSRAGDTFNGQFPEICSGDYQGRDK